MRRSGPLFLADSRPNAHRRRQKTGFFNEIRPFATFLSPHISPTERTALQTADIARRLMRGGELRQRAEAS